MELDLIVKGNLVTVVNQQHIYICNLTNGSVEDRTAALDESYTHDLSTRGKLHHTEEEFYDFVEKLHKPAARFPFVPSQTMRMTRCSGPMKKY